MLWLNSAPPSEVAPSMHNFAVHTGGAGAASSDTSAQPGHGWPAVGWPATPSPSEAAAYNAPNQPLAVPAHVRIAQWKAEAPPRRGPPRPNNVHPKDWVVRQLQRGESMDRVADRAAAFGANDNDWVDAVLNILTIFRERVHRPRNPPPRRLLKDCHFAWVH